MLGQVFPPSAKKEQDPSSLARMLSSRGASIGIIVFLTAACVIYYMYLNATHYVSSGSLDAERVANIAIEKKDPRQCSKIKVIIQFMGPSEDDLIQQCYFSMAKTLNDSKICEFITRPNYSNYRNNCLHDIATALNDISLCESVDDQFDKGACYQTFTRLGTDKAVCEKVQNETGKDFCYLGYVEKTSDISICDSVIKTDHYRDSCYWFVATNKKQESLCEKIVAEYDRKNCVRYIKETR